MLLSRKGVKMKNILKERINLSVKTLSVFLVFGLLLSACSQTAENGDYQELKSKVETLEKSIEAINETITNLELNQENIEYKVELEPTKLANKELLYTNSAIPMSVTLNDVMSNDFRVVATQSGMMLEYNDGEISDQVVIFYLEDRRSIKEEQTTFPYNEKFVVGTILPIAYQIEDQEAISKIQDFTCKLKVNGVSLYTCSD